VRKGAGASKSAAAPSAGTSSSVSRSALLTFQQARKRAYQEVRAGREFTRPELIWLLGYESLMTMTDD
jgi:hypothetical protein